METMNSFEVETPILNAPYDEPAEHWRLSEGNPAERVPDRSPAGYFYRPPGADPATTAGATFVELSLVSRIRERVKAWREEVFRNGTGVTQTTLDLMRYWRREGRKQRLFFAQIEARKHHLPHRGPRRSPSGHRHPPPSTRADPRS